MLINSLALHHISQSHQPLREVQLIPVSQAEVINHLSLLLSSKLNPFFVANIDSVEPSISRQGRAAS
ncbi:FAD-dependent monooxygenase OpS4 [Fusarium oxysporum f. sp. albedinis]|nr:FAD-dependent monooxygenase OpS4 [Fusarium oxysporum f. sp. albedinis]